MAVRNYVPTFAELIDRLSILLLKRVHIPENAEAYDEEMGLIIQDMNDIIAKSPKFIILGKKSGPCY